MIEKTKSKLSIIIFSLLLFVFFLNLVYAQSSQNEVIIKQVTDFDLKRPCFNNGTYCSESAVCRITITQPDGDLLVNNITMTNQETFHNITLTKSQTSTVGLYDGIMSCTDGGVSGEDTFDILITPSGTNDNSLSNLLLLGFGFLFSLGIIIFGFNREDPWLIIFGCFVLFVFGLYTLLNGVGNYRNTVTEWTSIIILGIAAYISVRTGLEVING